MFDCVLNRSLSIVVNYIWVDEEPKMKNQQKLKVLLNGTDVLNVLNGTDVLNVGNRQKCRLLALRRSRSSGILRIIGCEKR